jgi:hypothetical protein
VRDGDMLYAIDHDWKPAPSDPDQPLAEIDRERISQVWFVGVHTDIGGGYSRDGLSYRTLAWMMERAKVYGLEYLPVQEDWLKSFVDPYDKLNDSRHGLAGYYRYKPRNLHEIYNALPYKPSFWGDIEYMIGALINRDPEKKIVQKAVKKELGKNTEYIWHPVPIIHKAVFDRIESLQPAGELLGR